MRSLFLPRGPAISDQQFMQSALDTPLSGWQTLGFGARSGVEQGALGTAVREAQAPDLAGHTEMYPAGKAVIQRFIPDTPEQAAAKGETLYQSDAEYKASPFYRDGIPFEPGMTEGRAQALAEMADLAAIRNYYGSKRPITYAIGNIIGAGLSPENYIPILGESAAAVTTARIGKMVGSEFAAGVMGRAAVSGADAGLNAAASQLLTMPERARLGDDTSWQAFMENTAFAALAGTAFGTVFGGVEKIRERYRATPSEPSVIQKPTRIPEGGSMEGARAPDLTMGGDIPAAMAPDYLRPADILDRVETPAARARANAVMNDAVTALALDGEVRMGENSQGILRAFHGSPHDFDRFDLSKIGTGEGAQAYGHGLYFADSENVAKSYRDALSGKSATAADRAALQGKDHLVAAAKSFRDAGYSPEDTMSEIAKTYKVDPDLARAAYERANPGKMYEVQINADPSSFLDWDKPLSEQPKPIRDAIKRAFASELTSPDFVDAAPIAAGDFVKNMETHYGNAAEVSSLMKKEGIPGIKYLDGNSRTAGDGSRNYVVFDDGIVRIAAKDGKLIAKPEPQKPKPDLTAAATFSVPAPEPRPPQLDASYRLVDSFPKASTPEVKRLVEQAKAEGFDPEAGTTDLDIDIDIMRQRDALTEEEAAALAAAAETFKAAEAWGDVAEQLIACKATSA
jgi:hypothetical protein